MGSLLCHSAIEDVHQLGRFGSSYCRHYEKIWHAQVQQSVPPIDYAWWEFTNASLSGSGRSRRRQQHDPLYALGPPWFPGGRSYLSRHASEKPQHSPSLNRFLEELNSAGSTKQIAFHWAQSRHRSLHWVLFDSGMVHWLVLSPHYHDVLVDSTPKIHDQY